MADSGKPPIAQTGPLRASPVMPTAQASQLAGAVTRGVESSSAGPGPGLNVGHLRIKVGAGASASEVEAAVQRALMAARRGGLR